MTWIRAGVIFLMSITSSLAEQRNDPKPISPPQLGSSFTDTEKSNSEPTDKAIREFQGDNIGQVLRLLARQARINLVVSEQVSGTITMRMENMTPLETIKAIITAKGLVLDQTDGVYFVSTNQDRAEEPFPKKSARVAEALADFKINYFKKLVAGGLSPETAGKLVADDSLKSSYFFDLQKSKGQPAGAQEKKSTISSGILENSGLGAGIIAAMLVVLEIPLRILFAIVVFVDARRIKRQKGEKHLFGPFLWGIATLGGGFYVAAIYWYFHHLSVGHSNCTQQ